MGEQRRGGLGGSGEISAAALRASMGLTCGGEAAAAPQAAARRRDARAGPRPPATTAGSSGHRTRACRKHRAEHLGLPPPPPSLPAATWWPSGRRGAPRVGILSREEGIFRGRWRELLPPNDSLHAHRILAAVDEPQQFVQRSRCSSLHLGPRAEAGDERDDDAALSPQ